MQIVNNNAVTDFYLFLEIKSVRNIDYMNHLSVHLKDSEINKYIYSMWSDSALAEPAGDLKRVFCK